MHQLVNPSVQSSECFCEFWLPWFYAYVCSRFLPMQPGARPAFLMDCLQEIAVSCGRRTHESHEKFPGLKIQDFLKVWKSSCQWISWNIFFFATDFNGEVVARLQAYLLHVRRLKFQFEMVPPRKLTWQWTIHHLKMYIFPIENADVPLSC